MTVRLSDFDLIDACGMPGVESTSIARELGRTTEPSTESVAQAAAAFAPALAAALGAPLAGRAPAARRSRPRPGPSLETLLADRRARRARRARGLR